jgi:hypothetical protein
MAVNHLDLVGSQTFGCLRKRAVHQSLGILGTFGVIAVGEELHLLERQVTAVTKVAVAASGHTFVVA